MIQNRLLAREELPKLRRDWKDSRSQLREVRRDVRADEVVCSDEKVYSVAT